MKWMGKVVKIRDNTGAVRIVDEREFERLSKSIEWTVLDVL